MFQIIRSIKHTDTIFSCEIRTASIAKAALPGQFVMVTVHPNQQPLPIPIADFNRKKGTITLVVEAADPLREQMMVLEKGTSVHDCSGPFGQPSRIDNINKIVCIGGGIGVAALFPQLRAYKSLDCSTISIVGFHAKDRIFWQDRIAEQSDEFYLSTSDGSYGIKGRVTAILRAVLDNVTDVDRIVTVGSLKMMKSCADITKPLDIPTVVNLSALISEEMWRNGRMHVSMEAQKSFTFMERMEFDGHLLDFDSLISLEKHHAETEKEASEENPEE